MGLHEGQSLRVGKNTQFNYNSWRKENPCGSVGGQNVLPVSLRKTVQVKVSGMDTDIEPFTPSQLSGKINLEERMDEGRDILHD